MSNGNIPPILPTNQQAAQSRATVANGIVAVQNSIQAVDASILTKILDYIQQCGTEIDSALSYVRYIVSNDVSNSMIGWNGAIQSLEDCVIHEIGKSLQDSYAIAGPDISSYILNPSLMLEIQSAYQEAIALNDTINSQQQSISSGMPQSLPLSSTGTQQTNIPAIASNLPPSTTNIPPAAVAPITVPGPVYMPSGSSTLSPATNGQSNQGEQYDCSEVEKITTLDNIVAAKQYSIIIPSMPGAGKECELFAGTWKADFDGRYYWLAGVGPQNVIADSSLRLMPYNGKMSVFNSQVGIGWNIDSFDYLGKNTFKLFDAGGGLCDTQKVAQFITVVPVGCKPVNPNLPPVQPPLPPVLPNEPPVYQPPKYQPPVTQDKCCPPSVVNVAPCPAPIVNVNGSELGESGCCQEYDFNDPLLFFLSDANSDIKTKLPGFLGNYGSRLVSATNIYDLLNPIDESIFGVVTPDIK